MKLRQYRTVLACVCASVVAGCGGGSESAENATVPTAKPLSKYVGTYSFCSGHEKEFLTIAEVNAATVSISFRSEFFQENNCAGALIATLTESTPAQATFISTGTSVVTGFPQASSSLSLPVDRAAFSIPNRTSTLSGARVTNANGQACIAYTGGNTCIDTTPTAALAITGGIAFSDAAILLLQATTSGYSRDQAFPK